MTVVRRLSSAQDGPAHGPAESTRRDFARDIVQLMGMVSEGANVIYGTAGRSQASLARVSRLATGLLEQAASRADRRVLKRSAQEDQE